jgi:acetyltransferase-like isoleucine patch superfamily enzyme
MDHLKILHEQLKSLQHELQAEKLAQFRRRVSFGDLVTDRWENAKGYGFGEGSNCYDNVLILGDVKVGRHTWIGPGVILDGQGGLEIGDHCNISSGVQIYTHHSIRRCVQCGAGEIERAPTLIGNGVYIGPNSVVQMGIKVGDRAVIGAMSFVNRDIPADMKAFGCPARIVGTSEEYQQ